MTLRMDAVTSLSDLRPASARAPEWVAHRAFKAEQNQFYTSPAEPRYDAQYYDASTVSATSDADVSCKPCNQSHPVILQDHLHELHEITSSPAAQWDSINGSRLQALATPLGASISRNTIKEMQVATRGAALGYGGVREQTCSRGVIKQRAPHR